MSDLSEKIKAEAHRLGFPLVGITTADPPPHAPFYREWIAAGRHGEMAYLGTERALTARSDPRQILPECESVIALGIPHDSPVNTPEETSANPTGQIAAYAWGLDYHEVLKPRLQALVDYIEAAVGHPVPNRYYTDTGPILERDIAQQAGLGWIGKNSCLIHPELGSTFFLAEILLGLRLESDPPFISDHCGTCTRCIDACPTGCILPDRSLDASKCISYLTIELKGAIPVDLRPALDDWIFGCDICQQVCPWVVRFAPEAGDPAFQPADRPAEPDLLDELRLSPRGFNQKFKNSPVRRAKRRGYLRNVTVALGNSGRPEVVPSLARVLLEEPEALVRRHAAWALGELGGPAAADALKEAAAGEQDPSVRAEILEAQDAVRKERRP